MQQPSALEPALCPPAGSVLRTTDGRQFSFLGRDPTDPETCRWSTAGVATVSRQLYGVTPADGVLARESRIGLRRLFPAATGKSTTYSVQTSTGFWNITWCILAEQQITVPAGTFDVWVIENIEEGQLGNIYRGERIFYIEKSTGMAVKVTSRVVRGQANLANWEALSVQRPR
jgi:hypothetical protein